MSRHLPAGTSEESPVAEIEQTEPTQTPPETTHEEVSDPRSEGAADVEPVVNEVAIEEPAPTSAPPAAPEAEPEQEPEQEQEQVPVPQPTPEPVLEEINEPIEPTTRRPKGGRRNKLVEEDTSIDVEFAKQLDLSCGNASITAPDIDNALVVAYKR